MRIKTAFESTYSLGTLVTIYSSHLVSQSENIEVSFEIAVSEDPKEEENVVFVEKCLKDLGVPHSFVGFPKQEGRRYVSGISKSKMFFLDRSYTSFLWLDSDTVVSGGLKLLEERTKGNEGVFVVPKKGDLYNFNSGVFVVAHFQKDFEWDEFEESVFFSDQYVLQQAFRGRAKALGGGYNVQAPWGGAAINQSKEVQILHYVGEVKPWHINPDYSGYCLKNGCSFGPWYDTEIKLLSSLSKENREEFLFRRQSAAQYEPSHVRRFSKILVKWQAKEKYRLLVRLTSIAVRLRRLVSSRAKAQEFHPYH